MIRAFLVINYRYCLSTERPNVRICISVAWADTIRVQPHYPQLSRRNLHALSLNIFKDAPDTRSTRRSRQKREIRCSPAIPTPPSTCIALSTTSNAAFAQKYLHIAASPEVIKLLSLFHAVSYNMLRIELSLIKPIFTEWFVDMSKPGIKVNKLEKLGLRMDSC